MKNLEEEMFYIYNERIAIMVENKQPINIAIAEGKRDAMQVAKHFGLTQVESFKLIEKIINEQHNQL